MEGWPETNPAAPLLPLQMREQQQQAAMVSREQQAAAVTASQQELALMQQRLEVGERQLEVLRAQLSHAEGDKAAMAAEKRRLQVGSV